MDNSIYWPMDIPIEIRKDRLRRLQACIDEHTTRHNQAMVNTTLRVLIENCRLGLQWQGRTDSNRVVHITATGNTSLAIGDMADIHITGASRHALTGVPA